MKFNNSPFSLHTQIYLEAKEQSHGKFTSPHNTLERLVHLYSLVPTDMQGNIGYETDISTFSKQDFLDKHEQ